MKSKTFFYLILLTFFASLVPAVHAQTFSVLHSFTTGPDGQIPVAGVTIRGNALYGTSGSSVYQLTHSGSNWLFSTLAVIYCTPNGCGPGAGVVFGPDGHLYGTTLAGGTHGRGDVFKLTPPVGISKTVACYWTVNDLHDFAGADGWGPGYGDLIGDQQGNMYGTTLWGGPSNLGTVYELTPSGNGYTESVLYSFSGSDGKWPNAGLVFDNKGSLFGTTDEGGSHDFGTVLELTYVVGVGWTEQVLYNFQNASDGNGPAGGLIFDSAGNLYGTTVDGGSGGGGTVFELSPSGNTWTFKLLYNFSAQQHSCGPLATLTMDGAGNLYGTTLCGGIYNQGSVFKLTRKTAGCTPRCMTSREVPTDSSHSATWPSTPTAPSSEPRCMVAIPAGAPSG